MTKVGKQKLKEEYEENKNLKKKIFQVTDWLSIMAKHNKYIEPTESNTTRRNLQIHTRE